MEQNNENLTAAEEKIVKYGNQKQVFLKTVAVIMILILITIPLRQNVLNQLKAAGHLIYYPEQTQAYVDFNTDKYNEVAAKSPYLPDFIGNSKSFSFGFWKPKEGKGLDKLAIFEFDSNSEPIEYVKNLKSENYKNHSIFYLKNQNKFYAIDKQKLFVSEKSEVLKQIIDNIESHKLGLFEVYSVRKILKNIDKKRDGTILILDNSIIANRIASSRLAFLSKMFEYADKTAYAIKLDKKEIVFDGGTIIDYRKIDSRKTKEYLRNFTQDPITLDNEFSCPKNLLFSFAGSNFTKTLDIVLALNEINQQPEYKQMIEFVKKSTGVDVEKDITANMNNRFYALAIPVKNSLPEVALVFQTDKNIEKSLEKLMGLFLSQDDGMTVSDAEINETPFTKISAKKLPTSLYMGEINKKFFVIGQQGAISEILLTNPATPKLQGQPASKTKVLVYANINNLKEYLGKLTGKDLKILNNFSSFSIETDFKGKFIHSIVKIGENKNG